MCVSVQSRLQAGSSHLGAHTPERAHSCAESVCKKLCHCRSVSVEKFLEKSEASVRAGITAALRQTRREEIRFQGKRKKKSYRGAKIKTGPQKTRSCTNACRSLKAPQHIRGNSPATGHSRGTAIGSAERHARAADRQMWVGAQRNAPISLQDNEKRLLHRKPYIRQSKQRRHQRTRGRAPFRQFHANSMELWIKPH